MRKIGNVFCAVMLCVVLTIACVVNTSALEAQDLSEGTYIVDSSLSCYVNAMGGVEFGAPLLVSSQIDVDSKQNKTMTLNFTKSSVTIYNITCDTFIDPAPASEETGGNVKNGTLGFYDNNGSLQTNSVTYTLSDDTALNSKSEEVHYVSSITFPLESIKDTYELTLYVNSNVMGVQFGSGGSSSNPATLTVDWNSIKTENANAEQEEYETLPAETKEAQVSTDVVVEEEYENNVVEKDGLNIHYANSDEESDDDSQIQYTAYLNMQMIWILIVIAVVIIIVGVVFLVSSKFSRKQGEK